MRQKIVRHVLFANVAGSWVSENLVGENPTTVAHRVIMTNPCVGTAGCAFTHESNCTAAACYFGTAPTNEEALEIARKSIPPNCDTQGCCGALPCQNANAH